MIERMFVTGSGVYVVELEHLGNNTYKYTFSTPTQKNLFTGSDLRMGACHSPHNSSEAARSLLSFLTTRIGAAGEAYFANYTPEQLVWANSEECEQFACEFEV